MTRRLAAFWLRHPLIAYRFHRSVSVPFPSIPVEV